MSEQELLDRLVTQAERTGWFQAIATDFRRPEVMLEDQPVIAKQSIWTPARKKAQSKRLKAYWANKKGEK